MWVLHCTFAHASALLYSSLLFPSPHTYFPPPPPNKPPPHLPHNPHTPPKAFIDVLRLLLGTPPWGAMKLLITCKLCIGLSEYNLYEWKIPAFPAEAGRAMLKAKVGDLVSDEEAHEVCGCVYDW